MPKNTKVGRCVSKVKRTKPIGSAIAICQKSTGMNYQTGKKKRKRPTRRS